MAWNITVVSWADVPAQFPFPPFRSNVPVDSPPASHPAWRGQFPVRPGVTYLNHGSFGPSPHVVLEARHEWSHRLESEPMDFFLRQMEDQLDSARNALGRFVGTAGRHLAFVDNATFAMNVVAGGLPLQRGDQVLANDHEYGAVLRIWRKRCQETGAQLVVSTLPPRLTSADEVVATLFAQATEKTRLIVVSHITSPTAVVLPIQAICQEARRRGIAICVDGPHAPAAVPVAIDRLGCDFYCASLHKWLAAPFGSGFLYVHPRWQQRMEPTIVSWGNSLSGRSSTWLDPYNWLGTRDPAPFLAVPAAIDYLSALEAPPGADWTGPAEGLAVFQHYSHSLVQYARRRIVELTGLEPIIPDDPAWYSTMIGLPLPDCVPEPEAPHAHQMQHELWRRFAIEVPIVNWHGRRYVRVSAHLYNDQSDIDRLVDALEHLLRELSDSH